MTPIDARNATWESVRQTLQGRLAAVYTAWIAYGPGTTRQLAERSGIDVLNVRPRTTDLAGLGLVEFMAMERGEGIYRARTQQEWEDWLAPQREAVINGQLHLL
jgi:hypothetical protein